MIKYLAFYLPQFHPVKENDTWYGKGFTEWTNVASAKRLFKGHYEPHIPADLGFYDLRIPEIRREQAEMAKQYGLSAFCYWNYWFGDHKTLLDMPIWEVYKDKTIDFDFCLAWANHSWEKKLWDKNSKNEMIVEQKYLGLKDYTDYFYYVLPLFKDKRYFKVEGKLFFAIYMPLAFDEVTDFINLWRKLAKKEGLPGFFFVGHDSDCREKNRILNLGFDAVYDDNTINIHHNLKTISKAWLLIKRKLFGVPTVFDYRKACRYMITRNSSDDNVIPVIAPNWDHSPRSGKQSIILKNSNPKAFGELVTNSIEAVKNKPQERRIVIIKSWNEWGEGNHLEPDLKYGRGYLEELKKATDKYYENDK